MIKRKKTTKKKHKKFADLLPLGLPRTLTYNMGFKPKLKPLNFVLDPILVELVCTGCKESLYYTIVNHGESYPDLQEVEKSLLTLGVKFRHTGEIFTSEKAKRIGIPSGYSYCGDYKAVKLWRVWEDPKKYGDSNEHLDTKDSETDKKI